MFLPVIKDDECTNCLECAKICPKNVFDREQDEVTVSDPSLCTGCESCSAVCPQKAIRVEEI